jgi:uncharacterized protein with von Willebrand factor type A (vWA) domain
MESKNVLYPTSTDLAGLAGLLCRFAAALRAAGLPVSPAEVIDGSAALLEVGLAERTVVRSALSAALCKRPEDGAVFDELFALFFDALVEDGQATPAASAGGDAASLAADLVAAGLDAERAAALAAQVAERAGAMGAAAQSAAGASGQSAGRMLAGARARVEGRFDPGQNPLAIGRLIYAVRETLGMEAADRQLGELVDTLEEDLDGPEAGTLRRVLAARSGRLRAALDELLRGERERRSAPLRRRFQRQALAERSFAGASEAEVAEMQREVLRLARRLRGTLRPRRENNRRGTLDIKRTVRRSLATDGVPVDVKRARRRRDRPRLVALCDISDSVRNVSRFFLSLAHTLQSEVVKVRSFVFVAGATEVTELFGRTSLARAVDLCYQGRDLEGNRLLDVLVGSDYGASLEAFASRYLDSLTPRTHLLIIGDARSNYAEPRAELLGALRARARRLVWFQPEGRLSWGLGDSAMKAYAPHCDEIHVVNNLQTLGRAVDRLMVAG